MNWPNALRKCRSPISVLFLIGLSGCAGNGFTPLERSLPPAPEFARPVAYAPGRDLRESCYVALDRNEGTTRQANSTIVRFRKWYEDVRRDYNPNQEKKRG